jgi:tetratricopeptide (TPR) repeat protein
LAPAHLGGQPAAAPPGGPAAPASPYAGPYRLPYPPGGQPNPFAAAAAEVNRARARKRRRVSLVAVLAVVALMVGAGVFGYVAEADRAESYGEAVALMRQSEYQAALDILVGLDDYKDAAARAETCRGYLAYEDADALFAAGDYEAAKAAFEALGDFHNAAARALECQDQLDFAAGQEALEAGDLDGAIAIFAELVLYGWPSAEPWYNKALYVRAEQRLAAGDRYGAYRDFHEAKDYEDAAARAAACTTPFPPSNLIERDNAYASAISQVTFVATDLAFYIKLYDADAFVASIFVNPGDSVILGLRPGAYTIHGAYGAAWFGEDVKFGDEGVYLAMQSAQGDNFKVEAGMGYGLTLPTAADAPYTGSRLDRQHF